MNMLRHIAQNNGVVTDGNLRMIQELVDFLLQNSINTFQTEFRKLVAEATPSNDFHNPFLLEQETAQQPVQRILFPSTPLPRKRSRLIDELEAEEDSDLDIGRATRLPIDYPYITYSRYVDSRWGKSRSFCFIRRKPSSAALLC